MESEFYVIAFESTHHAIMVEKKLKERFKVDMIPTPREITASCGLSIKFSPKLFDDIENMLLRLDMPVDQIGIYRIRRKEGRNVVENIVRGN